MTCYEYIITQCQRPSKDYMLGILLLSVPTN